MRLSCKTDRSLAGLAAQPMGEREDASRRRSTATGVENHDEHQGEEHERESSAETTGRGDRPGLPRIGVGKDRGRGRGRGRPTLRFAISRQAGGR